MRWAVVVLTVAACGRVGFDPLSWTQTADAHGSVDGLTDDGSVDGTVATTVCGNAICEGSLGERCGLCTGDCAVAEPVCGNAQCGPNENCYADCGPTSWPWTVEETDLLTAINSARTGGVTCPGDMLMRTAPALTATTSMVPGVREEVWENAYAQWFQSSGVSCNGRTFAQRQQPYAGNGGLETVSTTGPFASVTQVVDTWKTDMALCPVLMTTGYTQASTAVAHDAWDAYAVWFK